MSLACKLYSGMVQHEANLIPVGHCAYIGKSLRLEVRSTTIFRIEIQPIGLLRAPNPGAARHVPRRRAARPEQSSSRLAGLETHVFLGCEGVDGRIQRPEHATNLQSQERARWRSSGRTQKPAKRVTVQAARLYMLCDVHHEPLCMHTRCSMPGYNPTSRITTSAADPMQCRNRPSRGQRRAPAGGHARWSRDSIEVERSSGKSGEPRFREVEPARRVAAAGWGLEAGERRRRAMARSVAAWARLTCYVIRNTLMP